MTEDAFDSPATIAKLRRFFTQCVTRRGHADAFAARLQPQLVRRLVEETLRAAALRVALRRGESPTARADEDAWRDALSVEALTRCGELRS